MIVYNYSSNLVNTSKKSYSKTKTTTNFAKGNNFFGSIITLENKFLIQLFVIFILTVAVFVSVQGLFSGTTLSTSAQVGSTTNIVTNFEANTSSGSRNSPRLIEIK